MHWAYTFYWHSCMRIFVCPYSTCTQLCCINPTMIAKSSIQNWRASQSIPYINFISFVCSLWHVIWIPLYSLPLPPHLSHCLEWTVLHRNKSSIKIWVCNPKGTGTSASGVGVPVLVQHGPDVCPASLQGLYSSALSPLPCFHGYRTNPSGLWKCLSVIQPLSLFATETYWVFLKCFACLCVWCVAWGLPYRYASVAHLSVVEHRSLYQRM